MDRQQKMVAASGIYAAIMAILAVTGQTQAVTIVAIGGGLIVGLGWAFYAGNEQDS